MKKYISSEVEQMLDEKGLKYAKPKHWKDGFLWSLPVCPWASGHSKGTGGASVTLVNGFVGFRCWHDSCAGRRGTDLIRPTVLPDPSDDCCDFETFLRGEK